MGFIDEGRHGGEEKRLQRALMSQPFRQTTLLQPAAAYMPETTYT